MATDIKTVEFASPTLAAVTDNTLTSFTQITIELPESGSKTFRSVVATVSGMGTATATGNITSRQIQCRLGAAGYTTNTNANLYTGSGEDIFMEHAVDLTSHFTTNWSGTSMTFDAQVLIDGTATGIAWTNVSLNVSITYEYDDTATTQVKTVWLPLDAPVGAFATTKPGTATATIPDLDVALPEASKVYLNEHIVLIGNTGAGADATITMQLDSTASHTSGTWEGVSATDMAFRYIWDCSAVLDETNTMGFYLWGSVAKFNHVQAYLVITYKFDASAANDIFVSLRLPSSGGQPGTATGSSTNYLRVFAEVWLPEANITSAEQAYFAYWATPGVTAGLNMRLGTGSFVAYTDTGVMLAGHAAAMIRNDSAFTLTQGKNIFTADVYNTETTQDLMAAFDGFFIINYTCDKPTGGHGAVSKSRRKWVGAPYNGASAIVFTPSAMALDIPQSDYYIQNIGVHCEFYCNSTQGGFAAMIDVERLSSENNGMTWDNICAYAAASDFETGIYRTIVDCTPHFEQFPGDLREGFISIRRPPETARRWRLQLTPQVAFWHSTSIWYTYHAQTWTVSGTVAGSAGGTVTLKLHRDETGNLVKSTTRSGNGSYSFTWYNPVEDMYVEAYEDGTHLGRSDTDVAA